MSHKGASSKVADIVEDLTKGSGEAERRRTETYGEDVSGLG
jgi:hypothetical protein